MHTTDRGRVQETVITPQSGAIGPFLRELYEYRELLLFLVWKDIKVQFAQTTLGLGWLILRPLLNVMVLTLVFGKIARVPSDGVPYLLFALAGMLPWAYFAATVGKSATSLIGNAGMVTKIYFPRIYIPFSILLTSLIEFTITFAIFAILAVFVYQRPPPGNLLLLAAPLLLLLLTATGAGLWLAALAVDFRDVRHASQYLLQLMMFAAPVIWPLSLLPKRLGASGENFLDWYALYPMVGVIEAFRHVLLGTGEMPWGYLLTGTLTAVPLIVSGTWYFRRRERLMADFV